MGVLLYKSGRYGGSEVDYSPCGNSLAILAGDLIGITAATGVTQRRATITTGGGIWGFSPHQVVTDANGIASTPAAPSGVNPSVPAKLALTQYADRHGLGGPIAGAYRSQMGVWLADDFNIFIQRHKTGTRVNDIIRGKKCDLTYNATTLEFEVDSTTTTLGNIIIVDIPQHFRDNRTLYDSATFATDAKNAWCAFKVHPDFQASLKGLRY